MNRGLKKGVTVIKQLIQSSMCIHVPGILARIVPTEAIEAHQAGKFSLMSVCA